MLAHAVTMTINNKKIIGDNKNGMRASASDHYDSRSEPNQDHNYTCSETGADPPDASLSVCVEDISSAHVAPGGGSSPRVGRAEPLHCTVPPPPGAIPSASDSRPWSLSQRGPMPGGGGGTHIVAWRHRDANRSVLSVAGRDVVAGLTHASTVVPIGRLKSAAPPSASRSSHVSFDARYGIFGPSPPTILRFSALSASPSARPVSPITLKQSDRAPSERSI